ncbi:uncharacterized protein L201_007185 [Kwoniella dendrophila CBS 6074]|uniref:Uncharacterized protein n=1 Tax=Kwoniella dendrophila CBS 6074 TaxID=1295534 RepID=A0AAX4K3E5_9TREE
MSMLPPPLPSSIKLNKNQASSVSCIGNSPPLLASEHDEGASKQIFKEFEDYKFTEDPVFNAGLPTVFQAIRGKKMTSGLIDKTIAEAQWFYFTTRIKQVSIPFSTYTSFLDQHSSQSDKSDKSDKSPSSPHQAPKAKDDPGPIQRLNQLTEAMRMMETKGTEGQTGLTFDRLCELIKEGRADELRGKDIPDELNTSPPSQSTLSARLKPWQQSSSSASSTVPPFGSNSSSRSPYTVMQNSNPISFAPDHSMHLGSTSNRLEMSDANERLLQSNTSNQNSSSNGAEQQFLEVQAQSPDYVKTPGSEYIDWTAGEEIVNLNQLIHDGLVNDEDDIMGQEEVRTQS